MSIGRRKICPKNSKHRVLLLGTLEYSLSPLVMIMTLFSKLQKFRENERNLLNKVIITTSCGNDDFI